MTTLLIQNTVKNQFIYYNEKIIKIEDFLTVFNNVDKVSTIFVNVGPGSYTGIKQSIAFALGYKHVNSKVKIVPYSVFDLINFIHKGAENIFIYAWPRRIETITSKTKLKGYIKNKNRIYYGNLKDLKKNVSKDQKLGSRLIAYMPNIEIVKKQPKSFENAIVILPQQLEKLDVIKSFITKYQPRHTTLKPLYVNPVSITKSKKTL